MFLAEFESPICLFLGLVKCYPDAFGVFMLKVAEHLFFFFLGGVSDCFVLSRVLENVGARGLILFYSTSFNHSEASLTAHIYQFERTSWKKSSFWHLY